MSQQQSPARAQLAQLVCRDCGRTEDVDRGHVAEPCLDPATSAGFLIDGAEIVFRGLCPNCRQK